MPPVPERCSPLMSVHAPTSHSAAVSLSPLLQVLQFRKLPSQRCWCQTTGVADAIVASFVSHVHPETLHARQLRLRHGVSEDSVGHGNLHGIAYSLSVQMSAIYIKSPGIADHHSVTTILLPLKHWHPLWSKYFWAIATNYKVSSGHISAKGYPNMNYDVFKQYRWVSMAHFKYIGWCHLNI